MTNYIFWKIRVVFNANDRTTKFWNPPIENSIGAPGLKSARSEGCHTLNHKTELYYKTLPPAAYKP